MSEVFTYLLSYDPAWKNVPGGVPNEKRLIRKAREEGRLRSDWYGYWNLQLGLADDALMSD
jgi:hypothetical protein